MTKKQERFIDEYLIDINATQAAIRAGYSKKTAKYIGFELLQKDEIRDAIRDRLDEIKTNKIAEVGEIMEYLTAVMRGQATSKAQFVVAVGEGKQEIREVDKTPDEKERLRAAELLGKRYAMFTDRFEIPEPVILVGELPDDEDVEAWKKFHPGQ